ncbi:MAG: glycosyltransferase family protein [Candidatus Spechtbacteria bacterium]|nr:glycosyltransferase family protein [Candidatus Spechtbacteria bacterium]
MNTHIIIQARMGSGRLPGKILKDLCGFPMLYHVIERCRKSKLAERVILATTVEAQDNSTADFCSNHGIDYMRGSENDVLSRYYETARKFHSSVIVRVTADCPLIDPLIIDSCIQKFKEEKDVDYLSNVSVRTFPRGLDVEVFSFNALQRAYKEAKELYEREHVTPYIWENKKREFKIGESVRASSEYARNYRLTVDYPEDFELMKKIYEALYKEGTIIDAREAFVFLNHHPEIARINAHCEQRPVQ